MRCKDQNTKISKSIQENVRLAWEGEENTISRQLSERVPRAAGYIGRIKGHNHLDQSPTVGAAPEPRMTGYHNASQKVGAAGKSQLTKSYLASC